MCSDLHIVGPERELSLRKGMVLYHRATVNAKISHLQDMLAWSRNQYQGNYKLFSLPRADKRTFGLSNPVKFSRLLKKIDKWALIGLGLTHNQRDGQKLLLREANTKKCAAGNISGVDIKTGRAFQVDSSGIHHPEQMFRVHEKGYIDENSLQLWPWYSPGMQPRRKGVYIL